MAVISLPLKAALVVSFQTGLSPSGAPIIRKKTLGHVRFDAAEQDLYDIAHALFSLTDYPVLDVVLRKEYDLVDEG